MPAAAFYTLISLGLFLLSAVYISALTLFSPSKLFYALVAFSLACIAFGLIQTFHALDPMDSRWIIGVQFAYVVIVLMNPILLKGMIEPGGALMRLLNGLIGINGSLALVFVAAALLRPSLISAFPRPGGWDVGPLQYVRAVIGMANWSVGIILMTVIWRRDSKQSVHPFLFTGYILLALGSLLDALLIARFLNSGRVLLGFYPGLLSGLMVFQMFTTLSLSRRYHDQEVESQSSAHAIEESQKQLMRMAYFDDMTGRPNRKSFLLHLNHHIIEALSQGKTKAVFLLDLDNFRDVNDTFGYAFGDLVIKDVGDKIEDRFGVRDRLYRLHGNRFAILWDEIRDRGHALDLARSILDDLTSLVEIDHANLYMGVSMGAAVLPADGTDVNEVYRRCESALAEAKRDRNTFFFYSSELESRTQRKMSIVNALREALKKDQFDMVYQPIVRSDGTLAELEALIRCRNPALRDVSPEVFIGVAESSGLIIPITWWLLDRVAREAVKLSKRIPDIRVNINMSPKILKSRDLIDRLMELNRTSPISGTLIGFEITEGAIIENVDQVLKNLRSLRERGFRIALDDFGTGYSSLSYIKNLPLDKIKIDKRFVSGISRDTRDEALINSIISIADNLKMDLVAEGVEMPNQLAYLSDRGCRYYQGYLFSKPLPLDEIIENYPKS